METIRSHDNSKIKHIKKLLVDKQYREEQHSFVAEGARWVYDALNFLTVNPVCAKETFRAVFVKESRAEAFAELIKTIKSNVGADKIFAVADAVFDKISDTEHSQGILAELGQPPNSISFQSPHMLYLDRIRDPGNLGTIIRAAIAAGYNGIILDNCADAFGPKVVRSTLGALLKADIRTAWEGCIESLKNYVINGNYQIFAADMNGENVFTLTQKPEKLCLIIGSEADGIRPELLKLADKTVSIPMQRTESLNASVAAGILMYQLSIKARNG